MDVAAVNKNLLIVLVCRVLGALRLWRWPISQGQDLDVSGEQESLSLKSAETRKEASPQMPFSAASPQLALSNQRSARPCWLESTGAPSLRLRAEPDASFAVQRADK
ncbi:hypothetical protein F4801DRAFT_575715 [Xylaria longipes]|nr:hypothetical protein F4801DRAFT_575715 [Xylaria longipes]